MRRQIIQLFNWSQWIGTIYIHGALIQLLDGLHSCVLTDCVSLFCSQYRFLSQQCCGQAGKICPILRLQVNVNTTSAVHCVCVYVCSCVCVSLSVISLPSSSWLHPPVRRTVCMFSRGMSTWSLYVKWPSEKSPSSLFLAPWQTPLWKLTTTNWVSSSHMQFQYMTSLFLAFSKHLPKYSVQQAISHSLTHQN